MFFIYPEVFFITFLFQKQVIFGLQVTPSAQATWTQKLNASRPEVV